MKEFFRNFQNEESGAITVEWVVLSALLVGLAISFLGNTTTATKDVGTTVAAKMAEQ
ncbi:hypothetical protein QQG91_10380 [Marivivens sp. LCG002]|uniref:Flp family type IVb pilin n=1 Tax=Marivivens sp. LCG002 TaxID=3051171 RepID=UPI0025526321|nr:hypothetical protein [Marivivens sp. LCG002]WIV50075.1 hypothetical protein QQG91_10380 [Marivivens sp. LCG002]